MRGDSYSSEDGAVIRNIDACLAIASTVQTSLGPCGRNKIVINHLQKMILTSDAATILRELDVVHPAAKLLVMASEQQEAEVPLPSPPLFSPLPIHLPWRNTVEDWG